MEKRLTDKQVEILEEVRVRLRAREDGTKEYYSEFICMHILQVLGLRNDIAYTLTETTRFA